MRDQLLLLSCSSGKSLRLRVDSADGRELVSSAPVPLDQPTIAVTLAVPLPDASVAPSDWATLGGALQQARIAHLDEVATLLKDGLLAPGIQNRAPTTRQAMLAQMEQAFLDPTGLLREVAGDVPFLQELHDLDFVDQYTRRLQDHLGGADVRKAYADMLGKAATFGDLAAVDWLIDPSALYNADVGGALTKFSDRYRIEPDDWRVLARESDLTRYRDYLLAIWTSHASQIQYVRDVKLSPYEALQQLENRFHQRFTTYDDNPVNAYGVLAQILRGILVAPTGKGFGFAIAAADIAPQGAQAPRAYLDYLIGLTGLSAHEAVAENLDPFHVDPGARPTLPSGFHAQRCSAVQSGSGEYRYPPCTTTSGCANSNRFIQRTTSTYVTHRR